MNRIAELAQISAKPERTIVGLMSGTSLDGVDAALCRIRGSGRQTQIEQLAFHCTPYAPALRQEIESTLRGSVADVCSLNVRLGEVLADAALAVIEEAGLRPDQVDAIASHGQTVYHVDRSRGTPATLQIGEGSVIAERTGRVVVCDFRPRDISVGGAGAPLVAYLDDCLFAEEGEVRLLQNLGGIANVTAVTHDPRASIAFDTGPGNLPIDAVTRALTSGRARYDEDGNYSRLGEVDEGLLERLCRHPFLAKAPPKTTGREEFGDAFSEELIAAYDPARLIDLLATLVRFTARSMAEAYREHLLPRTGPIREVIVSGGGVHNQTLMRAIREELAGLAPVRSFDELDLGFSADAKEAVAFCVLGNETLQGRPSNLPAATGARRAVLLGKIVL